MMCRQCGAANLEGARFCQACGQSLAPPPLTCSRCGTENPPTAKFCINCGQGFSGQAAAVPPSIPPTLAPLPSAPAPPLPPPRPLPLPPPPPPEPKQANLKVIIIGVAAAIAAVVYFVFAPHQISVAGGEESSSATHVLALLLGTLALGGAFSTSILIERPRNRYAVAATIGLSCALLYNSVPVRPLTGNMAADLGLGIAVGCAMAGVGEGFFRWWSWGFNGAALRLRLRAILVPSAWPDSGFRKPLTPKALVSRWFVTIAASTGCVVGALMTKPDFWRAAGRALAPTHIFFTLLLTMVSVALIGPLEEYVFSRRTGDIGHEAAVEEGEIGSPRGMFEDIWENFSGRAAGRLALVFLFSLQPTILHSCLEETVNSGDASATFSIVTAAVGPAFVTYYWSAALQRGAHSVMRQAGVASTVLSAVLWYPALACGVLWLALRSFPSLLHGNGVILALLLSAVVAAVLALVEGLLIDGFLAFAGGWAIDFARRRATLMNPWIGLGMLGGVLVATNLTVFCCVIVAIVILGHIHIQPWLMMLSGAVSMAGWVAGLAVSGFPKILHAAWASAPAVEPVGQHPA